MSFTQKQSLQGGDGATKTITKLNKKQLDDTPVGFSYGSLVGTFPAKEFEKFIRDFGDKCTYYFGVAAIASFFALVQIALVPIIETPDCGTDLSSTGCDSHSRLIRAAINFFSYFALSLDALGVVSALLTIQKLARVNQGVQDLLDSKREVEEAISEQLEGSHPHNRVFEKWTEERELSHRIDKLSLAASRQRANMAQDAGAQVVVFSSILVGTACFFVALFAQVIQSQPPEIWIPFVGLVGMMIVIVGGNAIIMECGYSWNRFDGGLGDGLSI
ncbi:hypothetical protein B0H16DRAFT_1859438 [Mycena metata]|uniref:Uncharacterized protein n=1 Tax=Mycena metata TaxID=1033252 RepID=A0AAD7K1K9_9AGAR|nr:hypothetical protein B0H16DRAFT_1859438 [Mycena metata]